MTNIRTAHWNRWKDDQDEDRRRRLAASSQADHWLDGFESSLHEGDQLCDSTTSQESESFSWTKLHFHFYDRYWFCQSTGRKVRKTLKKANNRGGRRSLNRFNPLKSPILQNAMRTNSEIHIQSRGGIFGDLIADTLKSTTFNPDSEHP